MEPEKMEINGGIREMLLKLAEVKEMFNRKFEETPENDSIAQVSLDFSEHMTRLAEDITQLAGYNIRMELNL